jgi:transcription elongation factor Elf1
MAQGEARGKDVMDDEQDRKPHLLECPLCGGRPYPYDLSGTHGICTVECGGCDYEVEAKTPAMAADAWNRLSR